MSKQSWQEALISTQTDGPTLTAAAAASCIPAEAKIVLPVSWSIGKALRISASGRISSVITTPGTARFDVRLGTGIVVWDSLAMLLDTVAAHTNVPWRLQIDLVCTAIGSSPNALLEGSGEFICEDLLGTPATAPKGSLTALLPWNTAPGTTGAGFDSTLQNFFDMFFTQTVATGSMTMHRLLVESLN
jgi:hypothetical protein